MIQRRFGSRNANSSRSGVVSLIERRFAVFYLYKKYIKNIFKKKKSEKKSKKIEDFFREIFRAVAKISRNFPSGHENSVGGGARRGPRTRGAKKQTNTKKTLRILKKKHVRKLDSTKKIDYRIAMYERHTTARASRIAPKNTDAK